MNPQLLPLLLFLPLLGASFYLGYTPLLLSVLFGTASIMTFACYYKDKSAASKGAWRTPESTLHILSLLGGWPGAILAQQALRHKTQKRRFRLVFWLTICVNLCALAWLHTSTGSQRLTTYAHRLDNQISHHAALQPLAAILRPLTRFNARN